MVSIIQGIRKGHDNFGQVCWCHTLRLLAIIGLTWCLSIVIFHENVYWFATSFHRTTEESLVKKNKSNFLGLCSKLGRSKQFWTESLYKLEGDWRRNAHIKHADGKDSQNYLSLHFLFGICHCWFIWKRSHKISKGIPKRNKKITPCECNRFSTGVVVNFQQV